MAEPAELRGRAVAVARAAGERIMEVYRSADFSITGKTDDSPLTAADLASHRLIVERLGELTPALPLLSEESAEIDAAERAGWSRYWLIDPLDGTKEFIKRNGEFTVNIALIDDGRPLLGVVYVPARSVCYSAAAGVGAFRQRDGEPEQAIGVRRRSAVPVRVVGSRSHASPAQQAFAAALGEHQIIGVGSSLKFCLVAEGSADVYPRFGPTCEWDTAAAQCVVEQAGGRVTDLRGAPLRYNRKTSLLNPHFIVCGGSDRDYIDVLKNLPLSP